jgi:PAP2 superfamily
MFDISRHTAIAPLGRSPLTRRSVLLAGLSQAAIWAGGQRSSAAISVWSSPAEPASRALLPWTDLTLALIKESQPSPPRAARVLALVHVAMAEAAQAGSPATPAISGAATTVLEHLFPEAESRIAAVKEEVMSSQPWPNDGSLAAGLATGRRIGQALLAWSQSDGSDAVWDGSRPTGSGSWQPTPPAYRPDPLEPIAGSWRPWILPRGDALRPAAPPPWGSPVWEAERLAVQEAVARRTAEQAEAVRFWAGGPGTVTPAGLWIGIARELIVQDELDAREAARVLALTSVAMADAFICCWDAKYAYWTARPITADPGLNVLIPTPPFPSYTSGHSTISAAAATVLGHLFPADEAALQARAEGAKNSRLWAGIHFPLDNEMGALGGGMIGRLVIGWAAATGTAWESLRGPLSTVEGK